MKMSGKVALHSDEVPDDGKATELDNDTLQLLHSAYKKIIPRFKQLNEEYDLSQEKKRKKLLFCKWVPNTMEDGDVELLQGPLNPVYVHKKITIEDCNTGRLITYASRSEQCSCDHSFVQIISACTLPPIFGCIKMCFTHTFSGCTGRYALLDVYGSSQQVPDSKIWSGELQVTKQIIVRVTPTLRSLSPPLYTAKDEGKLWFLNSQ